MQWYGETTTNPPRRVKNFGSGSVAQLKAKTSCGRYSGVRSENFRELLLKANIAITFTCKACSSLTGCCSEGTGQTSASGSFSPLPFRTGSARHLCLQNLCPDRLYGASGTERPLQTGRDPHRSCSLLAIVGLDVGPQRGSNLGRRLVRRLHEQLTLLLPGRSMLLDQST